MDDNSRLAGNILEKKIGQYDSNFKNFIAPGEITVTITLDEYRMLTANNATREAAIKAAEKDKYARETEIKAVKEENARLKGENYDLKTKIDELMAQRSEMERADA